MRPLRRTTPRRPAVAAPAWLTLAIVFLAAPCLSASNEAEPSWDAGEYARMARPERSGAAPAEKPFNPADYRIRATPPSAAPQPAPGEGSAAKEFAQSGKVHIESEKYLDFDPDTRRFYSHERTTIRYQDYTLTADKMLIDARLQEAEAEGNIVLRWKNDTITADKMIFNFERQQGVAYHVAGAYGPLYFAGPKREDPASPGFQKINRQISILRDTSMTTCQFPIPHYRVRAREFILSERDRVFARGAVLYIWDVPVAYVPAYSRSLVEKSPWSFILGYDSELGAAVRVTYDYYFKDYVPGDKGKGSLIRRSSVQITGIGDVLSRRGLGGGVKARYQIGTGKHDGGLDVYTIEDRGRDIDTVDHRSEEENPQRYWVAWRHRSNITPGLQVVTDVDWPSDCEIHDDILDFFDKEQIRRVPERRARAALTWSGQDFIARVLGEVKDRVGRDRVNNFADNRDDDADFDANLDSRGRVVPGAHFDDHIEGLPRSRWARVSERAPQITLATPWLKSSRAPFYYQADLNVINNLDKGLNVLNEDDDSYVRGFDFYQALMRAFQLGESSSLVTKAGFGFGQLKRQDDRFHFDFSKATVLPDGNRRLNGLIFTDDETFLAGGKKVSLKDYDPSFAYGDFESRWTTRFTDALSAHLRYFIRQGTGEPLGEFYRQIGNRLSRSDIYDFRLEKHEVTGGIDYRLAHPDLAISVDAGQNLRSQNDLTPNEEIHYVGVNTRYGSPNNVIVANVGAKYDKLERDLPYDRETVDPRTVTAYGGIEAHPIGRPFWAGLRGDVIKYLSGTSDFTRQSLDYNVTGSVGAPIGLKWESELQATYNGQFGDIDRIRLLLKRDLHDAIVGLVFSARRRTVSNTTSDRTEQSREWDRFSVQVQMSVKLLNQSVPLGASPVITLRERARGLETEQ